MSQPIRLPMWRGVRVVDVRHARQLLSPAGPGGLLTKPIPKATRCQLELAGFTVPHLCPGG